MLFTGLACSSPTADETRHFISETAQACGAYGFSSSRGDIQSEYSNARIDIRFENDSMIVSEKFTRLDYDTAQKIYLVAEQVEYLSHSAIGDLDPQVGANQGVIMLKCTKPECFEVRQKSRITGFQWGDAGENDFRPGEGPWSEIQVQKFDRQAYPFCDADTATRVQQALTRLIEFSAGKI